MRKFIFTIFLACSVASSTSFAQSYNWEVKRVVDGDTIEVVSTMLPTELKLFVRVNGVDTPEKGSRAKCPEERALSEKATNYTKKVIKTARSITFSKIKWDKYGGRVLADVSIDGNSLSDSLVKQGLARVYHGEKKQGWCH